MLHHLSLSVSDIDKSSAFYDAVLGALGYVRVWKFSDAVGYGLPGQDDNFAIKTKTKQIFVPNKGFHVAFTANSNTDVDAFYFVAIENGAKDNGVPGLRPKYGAGYYAAFIIDLDGYEIEAVFQSV